MLSVAIPNGEDGKSACIDGFLVGPVNLRRVFSGVVPATLAIV